MFNVFYNSIRGSAVTRAKDPVVGTFLISWGFCNWDKLAVLFLGSDAVEQRIQTLSKSMSIITSPSLVWMDPDLLILPFVLSLLYLFALPQLSLWVKKKQNKVILSGHDHAIALDTHRIEKQKELSKIKLRANPEKEFLAKEVENDLQSERERYQRRHKVKEYIDQKARAAKAEADIKVNEAEKNRIDIDSKRRQDAIEKGRFEMQAAIYKSTTASARFPVIYQLMHMLSQHLRDDGVLLSLTGLSNAVAALFGYSDSEEMMNDNKFQAESFNNVIYIYHEPRFLYKKLEEIAEEEMSDDWELLGGAVFDGLLTVLEKFSLELLSAEALANKISESISMMKYDILNRDEVSGAMATTDTIYDEIEFDLEGFKFDTDFEVEVSGYATGYHRKEVDVRGLDLLVQVKAIASPVVGKFGLSEFKLKEVSAEPSTYDP